MTVNVRSNFLSNLFIDWKQGFFLGVNLNRQHRYYQTRFSNCLLCLLRSFLCWVFLINLKRIIMKMEFVLQRKSITIMVQFSPLRISMRLTAMLLSGIRIALAILMLGNGSITGMVPAQIPTKIEISFYVTNN